MAHNSVLSLGLDPVLLQTRSEVLRAAGYLVHTATSTDAAIQMLVSGDLDLVVICHSLPARERSRVIAAIKAAKPSAKVLVVRTNGEATKGEADASVHSLDGPESLLARVASLIRALNALPENAPAN
jgi:CheY-like chemotaxis protein